MFLNCCSVVTSLIEISHSSNCFDRAGLISTNIRERYFLSSAQKSCSDFSYPERSRCRWLDIKQKAYNSIPREARVQSAKMEMAAAYSSFLVNIRGKSSLVKR